MGLVNWVMGGMTFGFLLIGVAPDSRASASGNGTYDIFQNGSRVGSERFTLSEAEDGQVTLEGECVLEVGGVSTTLRPTLIFDAATLAPRRYTRVIDRGERVDQVEAVFDGGKAVLSLKENGSSSKRNLRIKPAELVIDDHVVSLLTLVVRHYDFDKGGEQDVAVFDTGAAKVHMAHVMIRGMGSFENARGSYRMKRLTINLENMAVDLLVDDNGQVPLISMPIRNIEARLSGYDGNAKAEVLSGK
ncbi:MAG: hypothetical protein SGI90_00795 [Candidatus Eisenbacteria bacterium]|nr:hypothetical protein [Candidatus Eisenbacteria bacterium]